MYQIIRLKTNFEIRMIYLQMSFIKSEDLGNDDLASDFDIMKIMRMYGCGMYF